MLPKYIFYKWLVRIVNAASKKQLTDQICARYRLHLFKTSVEEEKSNHVLSRTARLLGSMLNQETLPLLGASACQASYKACRLPSRGYQTHGTARGERASVDLLKALVNLLEPAVDLFKSLVDLFETLVNLFKPLVNLLKSLVNLLKPFIDLFKPLVDLFETLINLLKPVVDLFETLINLFKPLVDLFKPFVHRFC